ncbi:hypothetical protein SAMN05216316_1102 [Nitrosovibrio sp. Nv6]|nr:hypothetical protein SAMN05216316_1102 [Nitrosovibrio sp. Nv6]
MACKCQQDYHPKFAKFWEDYKAQEPVPIHVDNFPFGAWVKGPDWDKMPAFLPACEQLCPEAERLLSNQLHRERREAALRSQEDQITQAPLKRACIPEK